MGGCGMLSIYCHYSYAGYKLYNLTKEGIKEITSSERCGITQSSIIFFSRYGLKEAYLPLPEGGWMLLIHDIPSNELDDMGRKKTCSLQFIANGKQSRLFLAKIAVILANDMNTFEKFFASLFTIEDDLKFDYDSLLKFLDGADKKKIGYDKPWDRVYEQGAPLILYNGTTLSSSISEVKNLVSKNDLLRSVNMKWNSETNEPSSMKMIGCVYDIIQRIFDRLKIWND